MVKLSYRKGFKLGRVISKIVYTVLVLWVGGTILTEVGEILVGECSPFFDGLTLIGWETGNNATAYAADLHCTAGHPTNCAAGDTANTTLTIDAQCEANDSQSIVYDVGDAGVLSVIGLIALASIVLEFVEFKM